jgi:hypothetical protein
MTRKITIEVESSRFSPGAYWLPGAEYYAEKITLVVADDFDDEAYTDDELHGMAAEGDANVTYLEVQP